MLGEQFATLLSIHFCIRHIICLSATRTVHPAHHLGNYPLQCVLGKKWGKAFETLPRNVDRSLKKTLYTCLGYIGFSLNMFSYRMQKS